MVECFSQRISPGTLGLIICVCARTMKSLPPFDEPAFEGIKFSPTNVIFVGYNRTSHLPQRREMMQKWADYLDGLRREGVPHPMVAA